MSFDTRNNSIIEKNPLDRIDQVIEDRFQSENSSLLNGLGGCALYFSNRFIQTNKTKYQDYYIDIIERIIESANLSGLPNQISIGHHGSSVCWVIDQLVSKGLLDEDAKCSSQLIVDQIVMSTNAEELQYNFHDVFYGFIGKAIIVRDHDKEKSSPYISKIIAALINNIQEDGIYWKTPGSFQMGLPFKDTINFGIPHGMCGILLFLIKCFEEFEIHKNLAEPIENSIDWLISQLTKNNNSIPHIMYSEKPLTSGRLAWCYGDLSIAYTLLRGYEVLKHERARTKAFELLEKAIAKSLKDSGVQNYTKYGYYDMGVCHGTSSVAYMFKKIHHITHDDDINLEAIRWINLTLECLDKYLLQIDSIAILEKENNFIDTSMGLLGGLSGVGLVLISFLDPKLSDWDKLLLLDRPGRE